MSPELVVQLLRDALLTAFWLALPLLAIGFAVGILMSLVQIVTSIQDSAFSTVPRLIAFLAAILLFLPWMVNRSAGYAAQVLANLGQYAR
jgi:flagellar biosynthetic protein FliQ